jgi:hypothetical protein
MQLSLYFALSLCPASRYSVLFPQGFNRWPNSPRTRPRVVIAPALGVQGLSLRSRFAMQGPRHLAPCIGAKYVSVDSFDPTPVIRAAKWVTC